MPLTAAEKQEIAKLAAEAVWGRVFTNSNGLNLGAAGKWVQQGAVFSARAGFRVLRSDPEKEHDGVKGTGEMLLVAPGAVVPIATPSHYAAYRLHGIVGPEMLNLAPNWFDHYKTLYTATARQSAGEAVDLDGLAAKLAELVREVDARQVAQAAVDELGHRLNG